MENVIEMVVFKTKEGVLEYEIASLFSALNKVLETQIEGFIKRELTKDDEKDIWVEIVYWESLKFAHQAMEKLPTIEAFQKYCSVIKEESIQMYHLGKRS